MTQTTDALYSSLGTDPDLAEIVEMFVEEMPERTANLEQLTQSGDWEELRRAGHQLKGAAGSYGFSQLTPYAARVEHAASLSHDNEAEIRAAVTELVEMCSRCRPGSPQ